MSYPQLTQQKITVILCKQAFFIFVRMFFEELEGLQEQYNDEDDDSIQVALRMMCELAFVPSEDVPEHFDEIVNNFPDEFLPIADYFEVKFTL